MTKVNPNISHADDALEIIGFGMTVLLCMLTYHYSLISEARKTDRHYWNSVSAVDLRYGSNAAIVSRTLLGFFRFGAWAYCISMWTMFFLEDSCCGQLERLETWNFALLTMFFSLGLFVSAKTVSPSGSLRWWEKTFVVLYEVELPMCWFVFGVYWQYSAKTHDSIFPTSSRSLNDVFTIMNAVLILLELVLNRIIISSRRWMFFTYLFVLYLVYMVVSEVAHGNGYYLYEPQGFLKLDTKTSLPKIIWLLIALFGCHYGMCIVTTIKQYIWLTPLHHPIEGAINIDPMVNTDNPDTLQVPGTPGSDASAPLLTS